jgi:hypothetical protein
MKKVKLFEAFGSDCKCGGNCTCGTSKVNEAKKLKYKDIHDAWNLAYGEDFEYEYEGVYQEIVGKHRGKISKDDLAKLWDKIYGEDLAVDYSGFFDKLDENLNEKSVYYYQEEVIELVKGLNDEELEVFAFDNNVDLSDEESMGNFIGSLDKKGAKDIIKQLSGTNEANADGTISDDEDERRDELEYEIYHKAEELIQYLKDEAEDIGGAFRSPGIISDCVKQIKDAFRKNKIRL